MEVKIDTEYSHTIGQEQINVPISSVLFFSFSCIGPTLEPE